MTKYTAVQHSAWALKQDPDFQRSLESAGVSGPHAQEVIGVGGVIFESYDLAEAFCESQAYPPGFEGLLGQANGNFSSAMVGGRAIYRPWPEESLDELVHTTASQIASNVNNEGKQEDYLLSNGWTPALITQAMVQAVDTEGNEV